MSLVARKAMLRFFLHEEIDERLSSKCKLGTNFTLSGISRMQFGVSIGKCLSELRYSVLARQGIGNVIAVLEGVANFFGTNFCGVRVL